MVVDLLSHGLEMFPLPPMLPSERVLWEAYAKASFSPVLFFLRASYVLSTGVAEQTYHRSRYIQYIQYRTYAHMYTPPCVCVYVYVCGGVVYIHYCTPQKSGVNSKI